MESIKLRTHIGPDGLLKIEVPVGVLNTDMEVVVVLQPVSSASASENGPDRNKKTPEEFGWPPGFFESTAGALADDPIEIDSEGDYEVREEIA